ncbi:MAG: CpaF family protein [Acidimicrobiales bacterium]
MTVSADLVEQAHRRLLALDSSHSAGPISLERLQAVVREQAPLLGDEQIQAVMAAVVSRVEGLGRLDGLLADPDVSDVLINGPGPVWIERRGELACTDIDLGADEIALLIERIVAPLGRRADRSAPIAEARLPDGSRVHIVLSPVAVDGPCVAIRRFAAEPFGLADFAGPDVVACLHHLVERGDNIVVSGGTGSGKTSLLNALASGIVGDERILTVEDAAELRLPGRHVVRFECQPPNSEGRGALDLRALVRSVLRLRPDRLIVGEVRGPEAFDLLQALNTGHAGSMATCHANGPAAALRRLEMLVLSGAPTVPLVAIRELLVAAVDMVIQVARADRRRRQVVEVHEVGRLGADGTLTTRPLVEAGRVVSSPSRPARRRSSP